MSEFAEVQKIDQEIEALQAKKKALLGEQRKEALNAARQAIRTYGFSAAELGFSGGGAAVRKRAPKYANPANPSQTWSGGARPKWVAEYLAGGGTITDLLIKR